HHHLCLHRQRIHRGGRRAVQLLAGCAGRTVDPRHLLGERRRALHAAAPRAPGAVLSMNRRTIRKLTNILALGLSGLATAIGLFFLGAILWTLIRNGLAGVSLRLFTAMTPPPGGSGGLLNAIYGSVVMTVIGILIGGPIGMLAGTYLAEYARASRLSSVIRFVNDVLLSAPSLTTC